MRLFMPFLLAACSAPDAPQRSASSSYTLRAPPVVAPVVEPSVPATASPACPPDGFEPNYRPEDARRLDWSTATAFTRCDDDWFFVDAGRRDDLYVMLLHERAGVSEGGIEVYDDAGRVLASTAGSVLELLRVGEGRIKIRVAPSRASADGWRLLVTRRPPACPPDPGEPNDTPSTAALLTTAGATGATCVGDVDWFGVPVVAGERLGIDFAVTGTGSRPVFEVLDPDGVGTAIAGDAASAWRIERDGELRVSVRHTDNGDAPFPGTYGLELRRSACALDLNEPNEVASEATVLPLAGTVDAALCAADSDRYVLDVPAATSVIVEDTAPGWPAFSSATPGAIARIGERAWRVDGGTTGAVARIAVDRDAQGWSDPVEETAYALTTRGVTTTACVDDPAEPDDRSSAAQVLTMGQPVAQHLCYGDNDWFEVDVPQPTRLSVFLDLPGAQRRLTVLSPGGSSRVLGGSAAVVDASAVGLYRFKVALFHDAEDGSGRPYTLRVEDIGLPPAPTVCVNDALEPNDDVSTASPLVGAATGVICGVEQDYFAVDLTGGTTLELALSDDEVEATVELPALGPYEAASLTLDAGQALTLPVPADGVAFVRVAASGYASQPERSADYTLTAATRPTQPCQDDAVQDDDPATTDRPLVGVHTGVLCPFEVDHAASVVDVRTAVTLESGADDDGYEVFTVTPTGVQPHPLVAGSGRAGVALLDADASPGLYALAITATWAVPEAGMPYTLRVEDQRDGCADDADLRGRTLPEGRWLGGTVCPRLDNLFALPTRPGEGWKIELVAPFSPRHPRVGVWDPVADTERSPPVYEPSNAVTFIAGRAPDAGAPADDLQHLELSVYPTDARTDEPLPYQVRVSRLPERCAPDAQDGVVLGHPLPLGRQGPYHLCAPGYDVEGAQEVFTLPVLAGQTASVALQTLPREGRVGVELYDRTSGRADSWSSAAGPGVVTLTATQDTTLWLTVALEEDAGDRVYGTRYWMDVTVQ